MVAWWKIWHIVNFFNTKLSSIESLTLTSDIWSEVQMGSFFIVTEFQSITMGIYQLYKRHWSKYLAEKLLRTCNDWGFDTDKVYAVVAENMMKVVEIVCLE